MKQVGGEESTQYHEPDSARLSQQQWNDSSNGFTIHLTVARAHDRACDVGATAKSFSSVKKPVLYEFRFLCITFDDIIVMT